MFKIAKPFFLIAESPLHAGSGNELGTVDQPIQREKHTDFPKIEGSSLKGAIREVFEENKALDLIIKKLEENGKGKDKDGKEFELSQTNFELAINAVFGPADSGDSAAALGITDARILLFPVKSMKGVYALVTCPMILKKFKEELEKLCDIKKPFDDCCEGTIADNETADKNLLKIPNKDIIILEEYTIKANYNKDTKKFADWLVTEKIIRLEDSNRLVVLSDDDFRDFINLSTEVITRNKINNETGTVETGHLFTEEYLPCETVMYSLCLASPTTQASFLKGIFDKPNTEEAVLEFFRTFLPEIIQVGGNATIGKGIVRTKKWEGA